MLTGTHAGQRTSVHALCTYARRHVPFGVLAPSCVEDFNVLLFYVYVARRPWVKPDVIYEHLCAIFAKHIIELRARLGIQADGLV